MIYCILKRLLPQPIRLSLRWAQSYFQDTVDLLIFNLHKIVQYKIMQYLYYKVYRISFRRYASHIAPTIDYNIIQNNMDNIGSVKVQQEFSSARQIVATFPNPNRRRQMMEGFEGFSPDDAVFDEKTESWECWSNAGLAGMLSSFAYANYRNPSILELGCGPAHLFFFLRRYGINNYIGIDGNPYFIKFNRHLKEYEQHFFILNLQQEISLHCGAIPMKFDMICCFEVLEHIREDKI